jgi:8-amino-7-oxononanoate synthase
MGTLSKALAGCGGYVAGEAGAGRTPQVPGAGLSLQRRHAAAGCRCFAGGPAIPAARARTRGHGCRNAAACSSRRPGQPASIPASSVGFAVIPAITGSSIKAARLASALFEQGIHVQPILYPAVPEKSARLRFFISCEHSEAQIRQTVQLLAEELARL